MRRLIDELFLEEFTDEAALPGDDAAVMELGMKPGDRLAMSTDSFVVTPHFFPGGNIGHLAVCGTVNDVATAGAEVKYLSCGFVLEEGYPIDSLREIVKTMAATAAATRLRASPEDGSRGRPGAFGREAGRTKGEGE